MCMCILLAAVRFSPCSFDNNTCGWQTSKMLKIGECVVFIVHDIFLVFTG